jgi:hypothetical protein
MTRFMQDLGSVLFVVEKQPAAHFEVQTPLIAAVVKGTQFTVDAGMDMHSVAVSEGLVEVVAMTSGRKEMVPAGRSAQVHRTAPAKLNLGDDRQRRAGADAKITRDIGVTPIDYAVVTEGLVTAAPTPALTTASSEGGSRATDETGGASAKTKVAAVDIGIGTAGGALADVDVGLGDASGGSGLAPGLDAGVDPGGSGGVGAGLDLGQGTGVGSVTGIGIELGAGGTGTGVGSGVGGTLPGQGGEGVDVGVVIAPPGRELNGIEIGIGGIPPGQGGALPVEIPGT